MAAIPDATAARIDAWWEAQEEELRPHLGASLLGHPCRRWIWLSFRWAVREKFSGRMKRLFERGQREEAVFVENLKRIGVDIHSTEENQVFVDLGGHVGGSVDGIIESGVPGAEKTRHIVEFKTHNAKSFAELKQKGVFEAKRRHWCQMQCYMHGTGIDRALYMAVCKDNDELYTERVKYDEKAARFIVERGKELALAERIPPKLNENPSWFVCKFCPAWSFCHETHIIEPDCVSCRTCAHVTPKADGTWECERMKETIAGLIEKDNSLSWFAVQSEQNQRDGCSWHVVHPDLVPWPLMGEDEHGNGIYEIDGKQVVNGGDGNGIIKAVLSANLLAGETECRGEADIPF